MPEQKPCRKDLLHRIYLSSFAVDDASLFLDTHPNNSMALEYYFKNLEIRKNALKEYAKYYGPLTKDSAYEDSCDYWNWINEPWPWQEGGC